MTDIKTVAVFGASGRQGIEQLKALGQAGFWPRGLMRDPAKFPGDVPQGAALMAADYRDEDSLKRAMTRADAVFLTPPSFTDVSQGFDSAVRVATVAKACGVKRLIINTSMYVPNEPMGQVIYDGRLALENALEEVGPPMTSFRPVLFMDNLLTDWVRPRLAAQGEFVYPHNPNMEANWICLEDVAAFMVAALSDDGLIGERLVIGGPETLRPTDVAAKLSETMGRDVTYVHSSPREFGELMADIFEGIVDSPRDQHIAALDDFYTYNNASNAKPMVVDMAPILKRIPVTLTPMQEWLKRQDWTPRDPNKPAPVGG